MLNFHWVSRYIDLSEIVLVVKAVVTVTGVQLNLVNAFCGQSPFSEHLSTSLVFFYPLQYFPNWVLHSGHIWTTSLTDFTKTGTEQHPKWHPKEHNSPASAQFTLLVRYSMHVMTWMPHEVQFTVPGTSSSLVAGWASHILHWQDSWKLLLTVDDELEGKQITSGDNSCGPWAQTSRHILLCNF